MYIVSLNFMKTKTTNILSAGLNEDFASIDELTVCHLRASSGAEAIRLMRTFEPDLVLFRWQLADMPGKTLLKRVMAAKPEVSVIAIVKADNIEQEVNARSNGATAVIDELVDDKLLSEMIIQLCRYGTAAASAVSGGVD